MLGRLQPPALSPGGDPRAGTCVGVCRPSREARTFLSSLGEDTDHRFSNCYHRHPWRYFRALLGEMARTRAFALPGRSRGKGHLWSRTSCEVSSGGGATARGCAPLPAFSSGSLAAPTPDGASRWPPSAPRPGPQQHCFLGAQSHGAWRSGCLGTPPCGSPGAEDVRRGPGTCALSTWARRDDPGAIYWAMAALGASMRAVRQASAGDW